MIVMTAGASEAQMDAVEDEVRAVGASTMRSAGEEVTVIAVVGDERSLFGRLEGVAGMPGVARMVPVLTPYKLVSREFQPSDRQIVVGESRIGRGAFGLIAGPCAVENREQTLEACRAAQSGGARFLRGGVYKPRTSPYAFQGLGEEGFEILAEAKAETGLPVVSEVMEPAQIDGARDVVDVLQIGARSMHNFDLLREAGQSGLPILLKRGMAASVEEWLLAAEYILTQGNEDVVLCERGIRTFETSVRSTLDLGSVALAKRLTSLPVIVDPTHAPGRRDLVGPLAMAATAVGADGLIVEIHPEPEHALCDGPQAIRAGDFVQWAGPVLALARSLGHRTD